MAIKKLPVQTVALFLFFLGAATFSEVSFTPCGAANGYLSAGGGEGKSEEAAAHALGEFRIVAANLIWLNVVDRYHHEFIEQRGDWSKNVSLLPYLRIITWLDPHFVQAYDVASAILCSVNQFDQAQQVLDKGVANNSESWQLEYDEAMLRAWCLKDDRAALPYAIAARNLAVDPFYKNRMQLFVNTLSRK